MRKIVVAGAAALGLLGTWIASAGPYDTQPRANAYFLIPFGGAKQKVREPLHYGLRLDYDSQYRTVDGNAIPALASFDFDTRGNRIASVGGVPFAGRIVAPQRQNEGDAPAASEGSSGSGGFTFFDWGLLAVGIGGIGYLIYEVSRSKESPDPPSTTGGNTGGASGGLLGGLLGGSGGLLGGATGGLLGGGTGGATGGLLGGATGGLLGGATGGLLGGATGGLLGGGTGATGFTGNNAGFDADRDFDRTRWLDGGTGQMGDIGPQDGAKKPR